MHPALSCYLEAVAANSKRDMLIGPTHSAAEKFRKERPVDWKRDCLLEAINSKSSGHVIRHDSPFRHFAMSPCRVANHVLGNNPPFHPDMRLASLILV